MAIQLPSNRKIVAEINITPLVDVVLVLLIIAMVLMPMIYVSFDTKIPERSGGGGKQEVQAIVLQISANEIITINKKPVAIENLQAKLHEIYSGRVEKTLFIDAADHLKYEKFIQILDICQKPGGAQILTLMLNGPMSKE
jgi:biopolymer transport protein ExbD